jgi:hypothetical protein
MFIGHFAVGLIAKRGAPRASLPVLLIAPQFMDILWPIFVGTGLERAHIQAGATAVTPIVLDYMPYSHSLVSAVACSLGFALAYAAIARDRRAAIVLGLCVFSHWVLDWVSHNPDMPIFHGDGPRYGLGLWNSLWGDVAVELGLFALGVAIYTRMTRARDRIGSIGWWALVAILLAAFAAATFGPPPPDMHTMLIAAFALFPILILAWWVDRHRDERII